MEQQDIDKTLKLLLSDREINVEAFIGNLASLLTCTNTNMLTENAEESNQALCNLAEEKMAEVGILVNHKFSGILKEYITLLQEKKRSRLYSSIALPTPDLTQSSLHYRDCFEAWTNSPFVSYKTSNILQLGRLSPKDCLLLHVFTFLTCNRVKGDNLFAICFSGASTVGKTTLWENPLYENAHSYVSEQGVGRWSVKKKNILFYHDINVNSLIRGKDSEKFKTISRTEVTVCKVFGKTEILPPLFVCLTSNMRVHSHQFVKEASKNSFEKYINFKSQLQLPSSKSEAAEIVDAVQNRILECFVYKRPVLDVSKLPKTGNFSRMNAILGMYCNVMGILEKHTLDSFFSVALLTYVLTGLVDNFTFFNSYMPDAVETKGRLCAIINTMHSGDEQLIKAYLNTVECA
jgi:hypothetical protein